MSAGAHWFCVVMCVWGCLYECMRKRLWFMSCQASLCMWICKHHKSLCCVFVCVYTRVNHGVSVQVPWSDFQRACRWTAGGDRRCLSHQREPETTRNLYTCFEVHAIYSLSFLYMSVHLSIHPSNIILY